MSPLHLPRAAEFPNDNPSLHRGARWLCPTTLGPARAVLRYSGQDELSNIALPEPPAAPARSLPRASVEGAPRWARLKGPLVLDLGRVVLPHRAENVPPPPDFIYEPFVPSSRPAAPLSTADAFPAAPLVPMPCRSVGGERPVLRHVTRRLRVDIAPCLSVEAAPEAAPPPSEILPSQGRRRAITLARSVTVSPIGAAEEVQRAIADLEAAFSSGLAAGTAREAPPRRAEPLELCDLIGA